MSVMESPPKESWRFATLLFSGVIGLALVGFFVGIKDGVPIEEHEPHATGKQNHQRSRSADAAQTPSVISAAPYWEMRRSKRENPHLAASSLQPLPEPAFDLSTEIRPSEQAKRESLARRSQRRAFNGAPPVVPHAIERTSDAACFACHGQGVLIGHLRANRMSHGFLANCLQCHAPPPPKPFAELDHTVASNFLGLATPLKGERAFPGAPPTIPHSTWMREQCLACHGFRVGWPGLEVTHPWRANCQQCHAPSAELEQAPLADAAGTPPGSSGER